MVRRPKHDPANARVSIRFVGQPTDPEIRHLQAWSLQQFIANAHRAIAANRPTPPQGAVA